MTTLRWSCAAVLAAALAAPAARAQEFPKPGPEHEALKKLVGTWEATLNAGGMESKGTMTYKMDLGGLWLVSEFEANMFGQKFTGRGLDSYDAAKKKYVGIWVDNMVTSPLVMEGTWDEAKKTLTMAGTGPGMDGKPTKFKTVTEWRDDDTFHFGLYMDDAKEPGFTIKYKRKK
jgi:hypothetical protein